MAKGTRNHVGSKLVRAPTGLLPISLLSELEEPAMSSPKNSSTSGAMDEPNVVHHTTPLVDELRGR